ncbi:MAG TPA: aspartate aminotransferase family protein, partial [Acidimicrobiales bacterium]|nr:aspartate aminotransferase family protein [Acidimicrobiales bacterium]
MAGYPYADRFEVHDRLPAEPVPREVVLRQLSEMATEEDARWEEGQCSGTMYCGDHEHYGFLGEAF